MEKHEEGRGGNNSSVEHDRNVPLSRARRRRNNTPRVGVRFSGPTYHGYYELNEKEVNSVAAKTVDSSGYFQL